MTLDQLKIFISVAEREHITKAAEVLEMTQSAVSAAISVLERKFGQHLFHRVGRGIVLTEVGRLLLSEARSILARVESTQRAMAEFSDLARGRITIHASHTIASYFLPLKLVKFHATYPGIELVVSIGNTTQVARAVLDGEAEIGFIEGDFVDSHLAAESIGEDQLVIVVGPKHSWADKAALSPSELAENTWVLREEGSGTRSQFEEDMLALGVDVARLRVNMVLPSNEAVRAAVEAGAGASALSALVCAESLKTGALAQANFTLPTRRFLAVQHIDRYRSRAVSALLKLIREEKR